MMLWSISTTVRNPERTRSFLKVLKLLEGQPFNADNQKKYQILLTQHKVYKPTDIPNEFQKYYETPELEIPYDDAKGIFYHQQYKDPAMRGRQSANPLNKLGFSIAREREGNVIITELGNRFIAGDYDIGYIFFNYEYTYFNNNIIFHIRIILHCLIFIMKLVRTEEVPEIIH